METGKSSVADEAQDLIDQGLTMLQHESGENAAEPVRAFTGHAPVVITSDKRRTAMPGQGADRLSNGKTQSIMSFFCASERNSSGASRDLPQRTDVQPSTLLKKGPGGHGCQNCGSSDVVLHTADSMRCCRSCDAVEFVVH